MTLARVQKKTTPLDMPPLKILFFFLTYPHLNPYIVLKHDSLIWTPGMCPWSWSVTYTISIILLLFRPWRSPSCIFCFDWMETNVNTHDVGHFFSFLAIKT